MENFFLRVYTLVNSILSLKVCWQGHFQFYFHKWYAAVTQKAFSSPNAVQEKMIWNCRNRLENTEFSLEFRFSFFFFLNSEFETANAEFLCRRTFFLRIVVYTIISNTFAIFIIPELISYTVYNRFVKHFKACYVRKWTSKKIKNTTYKLGLDKSHANRSKGLALKPAYRLG